MMLVEYIRLFRHHFWKIAIVVIVFGAASYLVYSRRPLDYQAHTTISIGTFIQSPNPDRTEIQTSVDLAVTYAELAKTYSVLQGVIDSLALDMSVVELDEKVTAKILPDTSLLVLEVTYTDPEMTADIANEVALELIRQSPTYLTPEQQAQIELAETQIEGLTTPLNELSDEYDQLSTELLAAQYPDDIDRIKARRDVVLTQMNQLSATIARYSENITVLQQRKNYLDIVDEAQTPTDPVSSSVLKNTLLGAALGLALAVSTLVFVEYVRSTFNTSNEASRALKLPVLGVVDRFPRSKRDRKQCLITDPSCDPFVLESYYTLQTNLQLTAQKGAKSTYLITSPGHSEGKTITAANLAIAMAEASLRVLLVDADLRRPQLHKTFEIDNTTGFSTFLLNRASEGDSSDKESGNEDLENLKALIQTTSVPGLQIIPAGTFRESPNEIVGSIRLTRFFEVLRAWADIDVILIDSPPCLLVADGLRLAEAADAQVIMVLEAGRTRSNEATKAIERFSFVGRNILGIVMNKTAGREEEFYGYRKESDYFDKSLKARPQGQ